MRLMNKLIWICMLFCCIVSDLTSQDVLSDTYDLKKFCDYPVTIERDMMGNYYVISNSVCELRGSLLVSCVGLFKFDTDLKLLWKTIYEEENGLIAVNWYRRSVVFNDDQTVVQLVIIKDTVVTQLLTFDNLTGSILNKKIYKRDQGFGALSLTASNTGGYYQTTFGDEIFQKNIIKLDALGDIIWERSYEDGADFDNMRDIIKAKNGDILLTKDHFNYERRDIPDDNYFSPFNVHANRVYRLSPNGDVRWSSELGYEWFANDLSHIVELDSGKIAVEYRWEEDPEPDPDYDPGDTVPDCARIYIIDSLGTPLDTFTWYLDDGGAIASLSKADNGDLIGVGQYWKPGQPAPGQLRTSGWIFRMNSNAELLWERIVTDIRGDPTRNVFADVIEDDDGNLVIAGYMDNVVDSIAQTSDNIWLIRLDADGCLAPGCGDRQVITATDEPVVAQEQEEILIYPNPVDQQLTIDISPLKNRSAIQYVEMIQQDGVKQWIYRVDGAARSAFNINTSSYASGIYIMRLITKDGVIAVRKVIVRHE